MNILLWAVQIVLALKFVSASYTHGVRPDEAKIERGRQKYGRVMRPLLVVVGVCTFLGAAGLIVPAATGVLTWLTPWSAVVLAGMMLIAAGLHIPCRERPRIVVSLILCLLAAFVAYGRWVIAPL